MMIMPEFPEFPTFTGEFPVISPIGIRMRGLGKPAARGIEVDFSELKELLDMLVDVRKSRGYGSEVAPNKVEKEEPFMWSTSEYDVDDDDDNEEPYIHESDVIMHEDDEEDEDCDEDDEPPKSKLDAGLEYDLVEPDAYEDDVEGEEEEDEEEQNSRMPKSILEMKLEDIFGPIVSNKAFKDALREKPTLPKKDPFVFIANNLTFLIKTSQPIIFDTSMIKCPSENTMFIAFDKERNPMLDMKRASQVAAEVNNDMDIQAKITEYLSGTEWDGIFCAPHEMELDGESRLGFVFYLYDIEK